MKTAAAFQHEAPKASGYRMPAEWEKHDALWLAWPDNRETFPYRLAKVEETFLQMIKLVHRGEKINLFVRNHKKEQEVTNLLEKNDVNLGKINFFKFNYVDVWLRDTGPIFITNKHNQIAITHWIFNAWGMKYKEFLEDGQFPQEIAQKIVTNIK